MKKIIFEVVQLIIIYIVCTILMYSETWEKLLTWYNWLFSAVSLIIIYSILKIIEKKNKKK